MIHCAAEYKFLCSLQISAKQREKLKERGKSNFVREKAKAKKAAKLEKEKAKNEKQTVRERKGHSLERENEERQENRFQKKFRS